MEQISIRQMWMRFLATYLLPAQVTDQQRVEDSKRAFYAGAAAAGHYIVMYSNNPTVTDQQVLDIIYAHQHELEEYSQSLGAEAAKEPPAARHM